MPFDVRIGTRGSRLALVQAETVAVLLRRGGARPTILPIKTSGDLSSRPISEIGGKGLFTKEVDRALLGGEADCAVHSMKDMEAELPAGLVLAAVLERVDPRDCLVGAKGLGTQHLRSGARIGTSAVRRRAQILRLRPDLALAEMRGNLDTRLAKLAAGDCDVIVLAKAGLDRIGRSSEIAAVIEMHEMLPAAGQGFIAVLAREDDARMRRALAGLDHAPSHVAARAERAFLAALGGNCKTPAAAHAREEGGKLVMEAMLLNLDGSEMVRRRIDGAAPDAAALGAGIAQELKAAATPGIRALLAAS